MAKFTITTQEQDGFIIIVMTNRAGRTWHYNQQCFEYPTDAPCTIARGRIESMIANGEKLDPAYWTEM